MRTKLMITLLLTGFITAPVVAQNKPIDYFGQTPPGDSAVIFAPGIISLPNRLEGNITFSPDGNEYFFTVHGLHYSTYKIYYSRRDSNQWSPQAEAPFFAGQKNSNPHFSLDGNKLFFDSKMNASGPNNRNIWMVQRSPEGWSAPTMLPSPINSGYVDAYYSESADSVGYFNSDRPGGQSYDIWCTHKMPDHSIQAENLGLAVNSKTYDITPCIAPDGSYLIFTSYRRGPDLYVTFKDGKGGWTIPVNMKRINTSAEESDPTLSPDGRFLFFTRGHAGVEPQDIYWVSTKIIDDIKKEVFDSNGIKE